MIISSCAPYPAWAQSNPASFKTNSDGTLAREELDKIEKRTGEKFARNAQIYGTPEEVVESILRRRARNKKTVESMSKVWEEYEAGKRGWRDGYVAARRLMFATDQVGGGESRKWRDALAKIAGENAGDVAKGEPTHLSEEVAAEQRRAQEGLAIAEEEAKNRAESVSIHRSHNRVAVMFTGMATAGPGRIDFYEVDKETSIELKGAAGSWEKMEGDSSGGVYRFIRGEQAVTPKPSVSLTFKLPFDVRPWGTPGEKLLICSHVYNYSREKFEEALRTSPGAIGEFCGLLSLDGRILFQFPHRAQWPRRLIAPIFIAADGKTAAFGVGPRGHSYIGEGVSYVVPREVWIWETPNQLTRLDPCQGKDVQRIRAVVPYGFPNDVCPEKFGWSRPHAVDD